MPWVLRLGAHEDRHGADARIIREQLKIQAAAAKKIKHTKPALIAAMRKAGIDSYRDDELGFVVTLADAAPKVEITDVEDKPPADEPDEEPGTAH